MAAMKPRTGEGPLEVTKEGRGLVMRVPLEGGGRLVVELSPDEAARLRAAGATVITVPIYRWEPAEDLTAFDELVRAVARERVDGVTFTSVRTAAAGRQRTVSLVMQVPGDWTVDRAHDHADQAPDRARGGARDLAAA